MDTYSNRKSYHFSGESGEYLVFYWVNDTQIDKQKMMIIMRFGDYNPVLQWAIVAFGYAIQHLVHDSMPEDLGDECKRCDLRVALS